MEETVPLASNIGNNSQVQQRATASSAATSSAPATTTTPAPATEGTGQNDNNSNEDDNRSSRRRVTTAAALSQSLSSSSNLLSPTFLISKLILILTILLKIALYPLRKLSCAIFPNNEFDGLTLEGVADNAAQSFGNMFLRDYITPIYGVGTMSPSTNGNGNAAMNGNGAGQSHGENDYNTNGNDTNINDDDDKVLLTTCPFTPTGYSNTIQSITTACINHQNSITNITSLSSELLSSSIPTPPPLMLIYLHSPFHELTSHFCTTKLCSSHILRFLNGQVREQQLICWGGSVHTADGKNVMSMMNVTAFPFLALVRVRPQSGSSSSGNSSSNSSSSNNNGDTTTANSNSSSTSNITKANLEIYLRMEGQKLNTIAPSALYTYMSRSISEYQHFQSEEISRVISRQEEINLRTQQDREYELALEEAQRREREKEEEERKKREEERMKVEEEERLRAEEESRVSEAERILNLYGGEPDGVDKSEKCVRLRLMLPSGQRVERRFRGKETIDTVKSFLILHFEDDSNNKKGAQKIVNFQLSSNYPKKALVDGSATLESEGLCPQAVIMVQDLDA